MRRQVDDLPYRQIMNLPPRIADERSMPHFRRNCQPGGTFFFTLVTARRAAFLTDPTARELLRRCLGDERHRRPFIIEAAVLLPDHLHMIWTLPEGDADFSVRWKSIKGAFTHGWLQSGGHEQRVYRGQQREGRRGVWQPRFMEHTVRDEDDFIRHVEYIHYNPVKHGLVNCPRDWPWSSFHRYVRAGHYPLDWCCDGTIEPPAWKGVDSGLLE